jgi:ethanolamine utilization protein EutA
MSDVVTLVGLDFGSTTSNCVVGSARLVRGAVGRVELADIRPRYRSELVFTPLAPGDGHGDVLDLSAIERLLERWLTEAAVDPAVVFGGGALLTGLAAERQNAQALPELIRRRLGDVLVAAVSDPYLESRMAFLGSVGELSRSHPERSVLNLDIGGGTTNPALGRAGRVSAAGCFYIGARHLEFEPGSYRIVRTSRYGSAMLSKLGIRRGVGDRLSATEAGGVADFLAANLTAIVEGEEVDEVLCAAGMRRQFGAAQQAREAVVTFSGGVGELVYAHRAGAPWPTTTAYGDLGIDLARRIVASAWVADPSRCRDTPASVGRATAWGLLRHATEVSGTTLYLPRPEILPLSDLPIVGRIDSRATEEAIRSVLEPSAHNTAGAAVEIELEDLSAEAVRSLGMRLAGILRAMPYPADRPLVLLVARNLGKTLGCYAGDWGKIDVTLIVIDEVAVRDAQFVRIGRPREQIVPISFFGLRSPEMTP